MQLGYIGLGKMGLNMVARLREKNHDVIVFDRDSSAMDQAMRVGAVAAIDSVSMMGQLTAPRIVWIMVPHMAVDAVLDEIMPHMQKDDIIVDGGNSPYLESMRRADICAKKQIYFLDIGVSGGPGGARNGACLMIGGEIAAFHRAELLLQDIAAPNAYVHVGKSGSGHFVKMVHNGIEYGMMQSIAEGFAIMKQSDFDMHLADIAGVYNNRSVIESRLIAWLGKGFVQYGEDLEEISGSVQQSGEGAWTVDAARVLGVEVPVIEKAVDFRRASSTRPSYTGKILSMLRNQFGGHDRN